MHESGHADELAAIEYSVLRATIAARGHLRFGLFLGGLATWAVVLTALLAWLPQPVLMLIPLQLLVGSFEAIRALHFGVERIGRYIQVFFEDPADDGRARLSPPAWETAVAQVGGRLPGATGHPLFIPVFSAATVLNLLAVVLPLPEPEEWLPIMALHAAFVGWMLHVDRGVRAQRAHDEARFRVIRDHHQQANKHEDHEDHEAKSSSQL